MPCGFRQKKELGQGQDQPLYSQKLEGRRGKVSEHPWQRAPPITRCINGPGAVSTSTIIPVSPRQVRARTSLLEPDFPGPTGQFTGLTQNGGYPAPYEDLEDEDDIADQEMEQEKQRTSSGKSASILICNIMFKICVNILAYEC